LLDQGQRVALLLAEDDVGVAGARAIFPQRFARKPAGRSQSRCFRCRGIDDRLIVCHLSSPRSRDAHCIQSWSSLAEPPDRRHPTYDEDIGKPASLSSLWWIKRAS